jgi:hypothetical protein
MKTHSILRTALFASMISLSMSNSLAQTGIIGTEEGDKTSLDKSVFGLGTNFSLMSGSGLSFKQHFPHIPLSYMVSGYVWKDEHGAAYNYGLEIQYDIYMKDKSRFYLTAGASYYYTGTKNAQYDFVTGSYIYEKEVNLLRGPKRLGGGIGYETAVSTSVGFFCNLTITSFQPAGDLMILPYGGLMIYFR